MSAKEYFFLTLGAIACSVILFPMSLIWACLIAMAFLSLLPAADEILHSLDDAACVALDLAASLVFRILWAITSVIAAIVFLFTELMFKIVFSFSAAAEAFTVFQPFCFWDEPRRAEIWSGEIVEAAKALALEEEFVSYLAEEKNVQPANVTTQQVFNLDQKWYWAWADLWALQNYLKVEREGRSTSQYFAARGELFQMPPFMVFSTGGPVCLY